MRKVTLIVGFALLAMSMAMAQNLNYTPTTDTLGAHNNGGRGCAGCHAPHSGGRGSGGQITAATGSTSTGGVEGDQALWGTDVSIITAQTLTFGGGGYSVTFGGAQQYTSTSTPLISGIAVCLSCHDGNVSKGAMMMNQSYEQQAGLLPSGHGTGATTGSLYGTTPIPTLLGNDGGTPGDYNNDHPIGPQANIGKVFSTAATSGLTYTVAGTSITWNQPTGAYLQFVNNYGMPSVRGMVVDAVNQVPYVTCTTCHNQHIMNVYKISGSATDATKNIATQTSGTVATYFFINAPYNPGAAYSPAAAPSTTQFCRQCHFSHANENYGVTGVATAF